MISTTRTTKIYFRQDEDEWIYSWKVGANVDFWFEFKNLFVMILLFMILSIPFGLALWVAFDRNVAVIGATIMAVFMTLVSFISPSGFDDFSGLNLFNYRRPISIEFNQRGYSVLGKVEKFTPYEEIESIAIERSPERSLMYHAIHIMNVVDEITTYSMPTRDDLNDDFLKMLRKHVSVTDIKSIDDK